MSPLPLNLVLCYLAIYTVTEGRTVRGIVGRKTSLSFIFNNINGDIIDIQHNASDFVAVWPDTNAIIDNQQPHRVRVVIGNKTASNTITVTIFILNLTKNDTGMYSTMRQLNRTEILDSVLLETIDETSIPNIEIVPNHSLDSTFVLKCKVSSTSARKFLWSLNGSLIENHYRYFQNDTFLYIRNVTADDKYNVYTCKESGSELESDPYSIRMWIDHFTSKATTLIENTTGTKLYTTQSFRKKDDTGGIYHYMTTDIAPKMDAEDASILSKGVPAERYLLFIIFGMGAILATAFLACRRHKKRICLRVVRGSNVNAASNNDDENEDVQEENQAGNYWTIVSNEKGEMSTAIEADIELQRETLLVVPNEVPKNSESEESMSSDDIYVSQEKVGYFNPISSSTMEFKDYIHPIHSNHLNTYLPSEVSDSLICNTNMSMRRGVKSISI